MQFFFIFYLDAPKKVRTQRKQPRRQHGIKPAEPSKSNSTKTLKVSSTFSKVVGIQRAKPVVAPAGAKLPQAHSNKQSKTRKRKTKVKNQKRNAAQKGKTKRSNENYYLSRTLNLHCANSNK